MIGAIAGAIIAAALLWAGPPSAHAQQVPPHVFIGSAAIDNKPVADGTVIVAYVNGDGVSKAVIEGGAFTLLVEQPAGKSFAGKIVQFTIGDRQAGESQPWEQGGAHELTLHAGGDAAGHAGTLEGALECLTRVLGRLPAGPQDVSNQEGIQLFLKCPDVRNNLSVLLASGPSPQISQEEQMRNELRQIEQEITRVERETPLKIQQEMNQLDREIANLERGLWDKQQVELERLNQEIFDVERQMQRELRSTDFRMHAQIEVKYRGILDNLERERFQIERGTQVQVNQEIGLLYRNREITERTMWDEKQQEINRLEQRRFELQDALERERFAAEQRQHEAEERRRFERERLLEEQRFEQQEELERQRIYQERQRIEQERAFAEERMQRERQLGEEMFRQQEQLDRARMDQERRLNQERFDRGIQIQTSQQGPNSNLPDPSPSARINLPTRGFFTNSSSGEINDIDNLFDPTSLAVAGIILTLLATSLSLVKGN